MLIISYISDKRANPFQVYRKKTFRGQFSNPSFSRRLSDIVRITTPYKNLSETRAYAPSYLTISPNKISELVAKYAGKGVNLYDSHGNWTHTELIVTNDENIGVVVNNLNGKTQETNVFKIHYSQKGVHIVPDYIRKKQRYTI